MFWSAATGLAALTLGLWFDRLIRDLFDRSTALGTIGLALAGLALAALIVLLVRELTAIYRPQCNDQQYGPAWKDEWIGEYSAPTTAPVARRGPGQPPPR